LASDKNFVDFIVDQIENAGDISYRKMFGEYAIYCNHKVVALVCDNRLFIKPSEKGKNYIGNVKESSPYPGAKLHYFIEDQFEDREWLSELIRITFNEIPEPKPKNKKKLRHLYENPGNRK
jgi:TfoX/Sxy family transcriptional regulator of competence genes